jgi:hypothetical protein
VLSGEVPNAAVAIDKGQGQAAIHCNIYIFVDISGVYLNRKAYGAQDAPPPERKKITTFRFEQIGCV